MRTFIVTNFIYTGLIRVFFYLKEIDIVIISILLSLDIYKWQLFPNIIRKILRLHLRLNLPDTLYFTPTDALY